MPNTEWRMTFCTGVFLNHVVKISGKEIQGNGHFRARIIQAGGQFVAGNAHA